VCPAAQAANFGLVDLQLTEADRRPFKLPLRLGAIAALRRRSSSSNRE
jgi:hypothetical protein